jgi:hypothetical protein
MIVEWETESNSSTASLSRPQSSRYTQQGAGCEQGLLTASTSTFRILTEGNIPLPNHKTPAQTFQVSTIGGNSGQVTPYRQQAHSGESPSSSATPHPQPAKANGMLTLHLFNLLELIHSRTYNCSQYSLFVPRPVPAKTWNGLQAFQ